MIHLRIKNTDFYKELPIERSRQYFDCCRDKFYHNIDSLYFMIKIRGEWNTEKRCQRLVNELDQFKELDQTSNDVFVFPNSDYIVHGIGLPMYPYFLESADRYSLFITKHATNNTPEIWVQIRSQFLWLYGVHHATNSAILEIEQFLNNYGIIIDEIKENRIDYAYHTNYIQDPLNFFKEEKLNSMQVSNFKRYSLEGSFKGEDDIERDYITLGRKKSNNLFFRIYNKTKEVVEKGYKQFFIELWYLNGLINFYDKYCLEKAFVKQNYDYLNFARLQFYLDYGTDQHRKNEVQNYINGYPKVYNYEDLRRYADSFMPKVSIILNVEIETKRKFYSSLDDSTATFLKVKSNCKPYANKLYSKLDNLESFHKVLTHDVIRFIDRKTSTRKSRCVTASWWVRLQQTKINKKYDHEVVDLLRSYQTDMDFDKLKYNALRSIASLSVNVKAEESLKDDIRQDIVDIVAMVTENEVQQLSKYKSKKFTQQSNQINRTGLLLSQSEYVLLNKTTGELLDTCINTIR